eukprot:TRINITY_DN47227_c0_g1_i1.p1 TRINITY_DN47227_c0_g1~~TRINITY_DN47227_c0_g1_i1.p1  ORF type:complete len:484 (+),score=62.10 TRINITY_DN47227_c0_g1_i1:101-1552(+)
MAMGSGAELGFLEEVTVICIQEPDGCAGGQASWQPERKPAQLYKLSDADWDTFSASVQMQVSRLRSETTLLRPVVFALAWGLLGLVLAPLIVSQVLEADDRRLAAGVAQATDEESPTAVRRAASASNTTYTLKHRWTCQSPEGRSSLSSSHDLAELECQELCATDPCCCGYSLMLSRWSRIRGAYRRTCELATGDSCGAGNCEFTALAHFYYKDEHTACAAEEKADGFNEVEPLVLASLPGACLVLGSLLLLLYSGCVFRVRNIAVDEHISQACADLTQSTGIEVEYLTTSTGFWKCMIGVKSSRAVIFYGGAAKQHFKDLCSELPSLPEELGNLCTNCEAVAAAGSFFCKVCDVGASNLFGARHIAITLGPVLASPRRPMGDFMCSFPGSSKALKLGLRLEDVSGGFLVLEVLQKGLVACWNVSHESSPSLVVQAGDRIVQVNGISGNHDAMLAGLAASGVDIELAIKRGIRSEPAAPTLHP